MSYRKMIDSTVSDAAFPGAVNKKMILITLDAYFTTVSIAAVLSPPPPLPQTDRYGAPPPR